MEKRRKACNLIKLIRLARNVHAIVPKKKCNDIKHLKKEEERAKPTHLVFNDSLMQIGIPQFGSLDLDFGVDNFQSILQASVVVVRLVDADIRVLVRQD